MDIFKVYEYKHKLRLGVNSDGGYVIADLKGYYDSYISAGISDEESFSRDLIEKYNMDEYNSFGFDGTINSYPYSYTNSISFIKKNINRYNDSSNTNLSYLISRYDNIFLKMDIEGGEYPWIMSLNEKQLNKFKQIVIEFHGINDDSWGCLLADKISCFEKLNKTHYIVHAHGNNYGPVQNSIPSVIELTYVNKKCFSEEPCLNLTKLPIVGLDYPNNSNSFDINLNFVPFCNKIII